MLAIMTMEQSSLLPDLTREQERIRKRYPDVAKAAQSVVEIIGFDKKQGISRGTGVVVNDNIVLTAWHTLREVQSIYLYSDSGTGAPVATQMVLPRNLDPLEEQDIVAFPLPEVFRDVVPACSLLQETTKIIPKKRPSRITTHKGFLIGFPQGEADSPVLRLAEPIIHEAEISFIGELLVVPWKYGDPCGLSGGAIVTNQGELLGIATHTPGGDDFVVGRNIAFSSPFFFSHDREFKDFALPVRQALNIQS